MGRNFTGIFLALLVTASFAASACARTSVTQEIRIGALLPLTGDLASSYGEDTRLALEIAVRDINDWFADVGAGRKLTLVVEDTATNPPVALEKLKDLVGNGIRLVIGPLASSEVEAVKPYADQYGILIVSPSSTAPSLSIAGDNVYRFAMDDVQGADAVTKLMWKDGIRALITLWRGDIWGDDLNKAVMGKFSELGGTVVKRIRYDPDSRDFTRDLSSLSTAVKDAAGAFGPKAVAVQLISFDEAETIFTQAQNDPILSSVKWYGSNGTSLSKRITGSPDAARFAVVTAFTGPSAGQEVSEAYDTVSRQIQSRTGKQVEPTAIAANDALWTAAQTYLTVGGNATVAALKKAFKDIAGGSFGATGHTALNDAGDRKYGSLDFWTVKEASGTSTWERVSRYKIEADWSGWDSQVSEAFPSRPVTIITGWLGGSEPFLKAIALEASKVLGAPVDIVNKVGNNGLDAITAFEAAPRDGHTLLLAIDFDAAGYARGALDINPAEDWATILVGNLAITQLYIRSDDNRFSNWDELVAYARNHTLKVASLGTPTDMENLFLAGLEKAFQVKFQIAPIEKSPERNASIMSGENDILVDQPGDIKALLAGGQLKPILSLTDERVKGFESVPAAGEKGASLPQLLRVRAIAAHGDAPPAAIEKLRVAFQKAFESRSFQQFLEDYTLDVIPYPEDPDAFMRQQVDLYRSVYRDMASPSPIPVTSSEVEVTVGDEFTIALKSNPSTGYTWSKVKPQDDGIVKLTGTDMQTPPATSPPVAGAPGEQVFTFKAIAPGKVDVVFWYARPWESKTPDVQQTFTVTVK